MHQSWHSVHFSDLIPAPDIDRVDKVSYDLKRKHSGHNDCTIIAEYKVSGIVNSVLSYDFALVKNLRGIAGINIIKPSEYWEKANIPKGSNPRRGPHHTNLLSGESWWRW